MTPLAELLGNTPGIHAEEACDEGDQAGHHRSGRPTALTKRTE
jgi:hypothetical protein